MSIPVYILHRIMAFQPGSRKNILRDHETFLNSLIDGRIAALFRFKLSILTDL